MYPTIDSQTLASIVTQVMTQIITQQPSPPPSVINLLSLLLQATASIIHQFKKLLNIIKYNRNRDCLNAWKQSLKQQLYMNHN